MSFTTTNIPPFGDVIDFELPEKSEMVIVCTDRAQGRGWRPLNLKLPHQVYANDYLQIFEDGGKLKIFGVDRYNSVIVTGPEVLKDIAPEVEVSKEEPEEEPRGFGMVETKAEGAFIPRVGKAQPDTRSEVERLMDDAAAALDRANEAMQDHHELTAKAFRLKVGGDTGW